MYSRGTYSFGICDRCGFRCRYTDMLSEVFDRKKNGLRVCPDCMDQDHPQLRVGRNLRPEPQALRYPRPERQGA